MDRWCPHLLCRKTTFLKDLLTHLVEVISKSWGRWRPGQILHCFRQGVLICINYRLAAMIILVWYNISNRGWMGTFYKEKKTPYFPVLGFWRNCPPAQGSFTVVRWMTGTLRMFLLGTRQAVMWPSSPPPQCAVNTLHWIRPQPLHWQSVWKYWHTSGEQRERAAPETPGIPLRRDFRREGEVEHWNALEAGHFFTSWTQWTLPESATSQPISPATVGEESTPPSLHPLSFSLSCLLLVYLSPFPTPLIDRDSRLLQAYWLVCSPCSQKQPRPSPSLPPPTPPTWPPLLALESQSRSRLTYVRDKWLNISIGI